MLAKKHRLTVAGFKKAFNTGKRYHTDLFTCIYSPSPSFHAAVVVSKKIVKAAPNRNRIRRRVYAILEEHADITGTYIFLMKKPSVTSSYDMLQNTIGGTIQKINK